MSDTRERVRIKERERERERIKEIERGMIMHLCITISATFLVSIWIVANWITKCANFVCPMF